MNRLWMVAGVVLAALTVGCEKAETPPPQPAPTADTTDDMETPATVPATDADAAGGTAPAP